MWDISNNMHRTGESIERAYHLSFRCLYSNIYRFHLEMEIRITFAHFFTLDRKSHRSYNQLDGICHFDMVVFIKNWCECIICGSESAIYMALHTSYACTRYIKSMISRRKKKGILLRCFTFSFFFSIQLCFRYHNAKWYGLTWNGWMMTVYFVNSFCTPLQIFHYTFEQEYPVSLSLLSIACFAQPE